MSFPTDAKLYHRLRGKLVKEAKACGVLLRQSYTRKSKQPQIMQSRYAHARQMKRSRKEVRQLKTYLGRVTRDIEPKVAGRADLQNRLAPLLEMGQRLLRQKRTDRGKLYSLHAPEVECIAKGKAHKRYEFGCKVSATTEVAFLLHLRRKAIPPVRWRLAPRQIAKLTRR